jgi:hypothetical protein
MERSLEKLLKVLLPPAGLTGSEKLRPIALRIALY